MDWEIGHEEEAVFSRADCSGCEAGGAGFAGGGPCPSNRDFRADVLSLEEAICRAGVEPGPRVQAALRRERATEEARRRTELGQGGVAGRPVKKVSRPASCLNSRTWLDSSPAYCF